MIYYIKSDTPFEVKTALIAALLSFSILVHAIKFSSFVSLYMFSEK